MAITREQYKRYLDPIIKEVYDLTLQKRTDFVSMLYDVSTTDLYEEKVDGIGALGLMKEWDGSVDYDDVAPLYPKTFTQTKYSKGVMVEEGLWRFNQHNKIKDKVRNLATTVFRTRQIHAANTLNNATSTNGPDGKSLLAADHPYSPENTSDTQSNYDSSLNLDPDNLDTVIQNMQNFTDDRGNKLLVNPDTIYVPTRTLYVKAKKIVGSDKEAYTADNQVNTFKTEDWNVVHIPWLTDTSRWFVADSELQKQIGLKWFQNKKPTPEHHEDFDTEFLKWKVTGWWAYGFVRWEWIYGCDQPA